LKVYGIQINSVGDENKEKVFFFFLIKLTVFFSLN